MVLDKVNIFYRNCKKIFLGRYWGMITASQCRAARALIGWSQQELAVQAGVGIMTVHQLEKDGSQPRRATLEVVQRALETAGVEFIEENGGGAGVRWRKRQSLNAPLQDG
jgi:transcriptional regulator with XRE-family HTH domain